MELIGYADKLGVRPGERIRFMVSAQLPSYDAAIVRLGRSDPGPAKPTFTGEKIDTPVTGTYTGRNQPLYSGSYVLVADNPLLHPHSVTLQAWIYPTTPQRPEPQGVITTWRAPDGVGYGLFVEQDGELAFWIGDENGRVEKVRSGQPLRPHQWYFVACAYDADERQVRLYQELLPPWPLDDTHVRVERAVEVAGCGASRVPLLLGAGYSLAPEKLAVGGRYNGKIDGPCLFSRALGADEVEALKNGAAPWEIGGEALVAAWDFAHDISSVRVLDTSPHGLHGETVNMPARAMTGHNWTGAEVNFNHAREQYGAIHFHEDDIEDARWEPDFELTVPEGLTTGIYAARLTAGAAEEYMPFYVLPAPGASPAPVAYLAPTMSYLAYANERTHTLIDFTHISQEPLRLEPADEYLVAHPEIGLSVYDLHADGSGICYSSRLRPILHMRPNMRGWVNNGLRHFAADLYLVDWLEHKDVPYDVLTDEALHHEGKALLERYNVIITGTHPEYWTTPMLSALEEYLAAGGRLMYLGGNGFYWVTSIHPERPHVLELRRGVAGTRSWQSAPGECYQSTTGEQGGLWRYRGKAPQKLVGVGFTAQGWGGATGYRRQAGSFDARAAFIFEGIAPDEVIGDFGLVMNGASGDELDRADPGLGTPPHALVLASSTGHSDYYQFVVEDILMSAPGQSGTQNPNVRSDMVYFETPNDGAVFSVGSINWCGSLPFNDFDNNVSRVTENVLRRFMTR